MVFVTGATGLVGSFICRKLIDEGYQVRALCRTNSDFNLVSDIKEQIEWVTGNILDLPILEKVIEGTDIMIHAAAIISFHKKDLDQMLKTNVEGTANLINVCLQYGVKHFVHISSVAAIGRTKKLKKIDEHKKWENSSYNTRYALSKYLSELEVWRGQEEGLKVVVANPSIVIGPGDWHKGSTTLFRYVYRQKLFYPVGSINYIDVRDLADIVLGLLQKQVSGERFIISAGGISYKEIFDKIAIRFSKKAPSKAINGMLMKLFVVLEKVKSLLTGRRPMITSETGKMAGFTFYYDNKKIREALDFDFKTLDESLDWTCHNLMAKKQEFGV